MINTPCADLELPFDKLQKKEADMGVKLCLLGAPPTQPLITESWAICSALPALLVHQPLALVSDVCRC